MPSIIMDFIVPMLMEWASAGEDQIIQQRRRQRIGLCWGLSESFLVNGELANTESVNSHTEENREWISEHVLLRYEMLYEAGLIPEAPNYPPSYQAVILPDDWLCSACVCVSCTKPK